MRQRIISAVVGLAILAVILVFFDTLLLNGIIGLIGAMAVLELLSATKSPRCKSFSILCVAVAAIIPFAQETPLRAFVPQIIFLLVVCLFVILLRRHETLRIDHAAMMFFFSLFISVFMSGGVYLRNRFGGVVGCVYVLWALGSAWLADTGAYFVGKSLGKHKLAPKISPNKTVEGSVGGLLAAIVLMPLVAFLYGLAMEVVGTPILVNYGLLLLLTPVFTVFGMLGDLAASVIKRQFGVKDFGHIMPGHGGVLDRFDSVLLTLPAVYVVAQYVAVVTLK
jgi:phosphatidate cytidylyltransferase